MGRNMSVADVCLSSKRLLFDTQPVNELPCCSSGKSINLNHSSKKVISRFAWC